jgi:hypothetical protein
MAAHSCNIEVEAALVSVAEPSQAPQSGPVVRVVWEEAEDWTFRTDQQGPPQVSEALAQAVGSLYKCNSSVQAGRTAAVTYILGSSWVGIATAGRSRRLELHSPFEIAWHTPAGPATLAVDSLSVPWESLSPSQLSHLRQHSAGHTSMREMDQDTSICCYH